MKADREVHRLYGIYVQEPTEANARAVYHLGVSLSEANATFHRVEALARREVRP